MEFHHSHIMLLCWRRPIPARAATAQLTDCRLFIQAVTSVPSTAGIVTHHLALQAAGKITLLSGAIKNQGAVIPHDDRRATCSDEALFKMLQVS